MGIGSRLKFLRNTTSPVVTLLVSLWVVTVCNASFWRVVMRIEGGVHQTNLLFLVSLFVLATLIINLMLTPLAFRWIGKPLIGAFLIVTAVVAYFEDRYGVMIDRAMFRNSIETDVGEVTELLSWPMIGTVVVLGVVPIVWLAAVKIEYRVLWKELLQKCIVLVATALGIGLIAAGYYQDYASLLRNHRELRYLFAPVNFFGALHGYVREERARHREFRTLGRDAKKADAWPESARKTLTVIVVGETARTSNFSLAGYGRETNPELAREDIVFFPQVSSCGTSTSTSLPCMFSNLGRTGFSVDKARSQEGLLDVLEHSGFSVLWRDNNSGCKGACDRVENEDLSKFTVPVLCRPDECYDEILLHQLQEYIDGAHQDMVVVLHQKGSHGPAYYLRYPDRFELFRPTCKTTQFESCSQQEILNAYDNTIVYTDHFLAQTIALLKLNSGGVDTAMIYVSDHGESLGEGGVYLHAIPFAFAPTDQTRVPMIVWLSDGFRKRFGIDGGCLTSRRGTKYSHDNLFHSVLGLLDVETTVYRHELDLFRPCRVLPLSPRERGQG